MDTLWEYKFIFKIQVQIKRNLFLSFFSSIFLKNNIHINCLVFSSIFQLNFEKCRGVESILDERSLSKAAMILLIGGQL